MGRFGWFLLFALLSLTPLKAPAGPMEDIRGVVDHWATAFNSNDVDALVNLYAHDAILVGTVGTALTEGRSAIRTYFARLAGSDDKVAIDNNKIIVLDNNVAYVTGCY